MNCVNTTLVILLSLTQSHEIHMDLHLNKICTKLEKWFVGYNV